MSSPPSPPPAPLHPQPRPRALLSSQTPEAPGLPVGCDRILGALPGEHPVFQTDSAPHSLSVRLSSPPTTPPSSKGVSQALG